MAIVKIQKVFMKKLVVLFTLLHFGVAGEPDDGSNIKSETKLAENSSAKIASQVNESSAKRYHFISNRDSYVNAANSFASGGGEMSFPQNSYIAPMQGGYSSSGYGGGMQQQGGYGWTDLDDDSSQSSTGGGIDFLGLVGLIGLKGLKGTLPLIKKITLLLIFLSPLLIPLSIFKLIIIFLKPVISFGREINSSKHATGALLNSFDSYVDKWNIEETKSKIDKMLEEVLSRGLDDRCMERIACEGIFKSIPRIFMKILGDNYKPTVSRMQRSTENKDEKNERGNVPLNNDPRRKDLATLALNKLKNRQNFANKPSTSVTPTKVQNACQQYKCLTLF